MKWCFIGSQKVVRLQGVIAVFIVLFLTGCSDSDERYDAGHSDGFAVGYNTACEIRATLIDDDFGNTDYAKGYGDGMVDGTIACNADRKAGRI
jgi:hypothetical protein